MAMGGESNAAGSAGSLSPHLLCAYCGDLAQDLDWLGRCMACFRAYIEDPAGTDLPRIVTKVRLRTKQASEAHLKDIRSRRLAEDGKTVIREKATRRYYTV